MHDAMSERIEVRLSRQIAVEPMAKNNMLMIHYIHHLPPIFHMDLQSGLTNKICAYIMCPNSVYSFAESSLLLQYSSLCDRVCG